MLRGSCPTGQLRDGGHHPHKLRLNRKVSEWEIVCGRACLFAASVRDKLRTLAAESSELTADGVALCRRMSICQAGKVRTGDDGPLKWEGRS